MKLGQKPIGFQGMKPIFHNIKSNELLINHQLTCETKIKSLILHLNLKLCSQWLLQDSKEKTEETRL
jgi:hypothetical protein